MKEKNVVNVFINQNTGEVIELREGDKFKITRREQQYAIDKTKEKKEADLDMILWNKQLGGFIFVLFKYCNILLDEYLEITQEDVVKLFYIATFVQDDGYLIRDESSINRNDLCSLLNIHISNFDKFFNKMKKLNILIQDDKKYIKMSKSFFTKGMVEQNTDNPYNYTRIYINSIRYLYENVDKRSHKQLGNYFRIIPYVHRQKSSVCYNPYCKEDNVRLLFIKDLRNVLNYTKKGMDNFIDKLLDIKLKDGSTIIAVSKIDESDNKKYIVVNPKVFYGGNFNIKGGKKSIFKYFDINIK